MTHKVCIVPSKILIVRMYDPEYPGDLFEDSLADIKYCAPNEDADANNKRKGYATIGSLSWILFKQETAIANGIDMINTKTYLVEPNSEPLRELYYTHISQNTIDEIGATSNPNIVILTDIFISAAWRNKGIGQAAMKNFIVQLKGICGYIIILNNEPMQFRPYNDPNVEYAHLKTELDGLEKDPEKAQHKLNAFWQRCGFKQFKNYDNVFICNVDLAVQDYSKAAHTSEM